MNLNNCKPSPKGLWQALTPRQQQQLYATLGKWAVRVWKAQRASNLPPAHPKGERGE